MIRGRFVLLLWAMTCVVAGSARADKNTRLIDQDAAVVARIDAPHLYKLIGLIRIAGDSSGRMTSLAGTASKIRLGHNLLEQEGYRAAGFDDKRPIWLQVGAIDEARVRKAFARLAAARDWTSQLLRKTDKPMWRSRVVIPIKNRKRAKRTLERLLGLITTLQPVSTGNRERLALLVGERPAKSADVVSRLRGAGVVAIGWVDGLDAYVALRFNRRRAIIEVTGTFAGVPLVWARDRQKLLGGMAPLARRKGWTPSQVARAQMNKAGIRVWFGARSSRNALTALGLTERLRKVAAQLPQSKAQRRAAATIDADCDALGELADKGQVTEMVLSLAFGKQDLRLQVDWALRSSRWVLALSKTSQSTIQASGGDSIASGTAFIGNAASLTKIWRPAPMARGIASGLSGLARCPGASFTALSAFHWPELAAAFVADLRSTDPAALRIVDALKVPSFAIKNPSLDEARGLLAFDAEVAGAAADEAAAILLKVFGREHKAAGSIRWGRGPYVAFRRGNRLGFGLGTKSHEWYTKLPTGSARQNKTTLARARVDVPALLVSLSREVAELSGVATLARKKLGKAAIKAEVVGSSVRVAVTVQVL